MPPSPRGRLTELVRLLEESLSIVKKSSRLPSMLQENNLPSSMIVLQENTSMARINLVQAGPSLPNQRAAQITSEP